MNETTTKPFGTILLYSQDTRGIGHITRSLVIADRLLKAHPESVGYVVTRSKIVREVHWPSRCDYIRLPCRRTPKTITLSPEDDEATKVQFRELRAKILRDVALGLKPDLVFVDHEPLGSTGEFRDGLWALKEQSPTTKFVFGLRDIMDDPEGIRATWRERGVYEALENLYDGIAVFGLPELYDVAEAYAIPKSVRHKLHYCGYVVRDLPVADRDEVRRQYDLPLDVPLVLAAVGSGYDGYPVLAAAVEAVERLQARFSNLHAIMVTGPFMPPEMQERVQAHATTQCRVVPSADNFQLMAAADAVVGMGGYNSVFEALFAACPMVIVPRATNKIEQQIRAELLAARDLARWIHPKVVNGDNLAEALEWALQRKRVAHAQCVREVIPAFDGADRVTTYLSQWLNGRSVPMAQMAQMAQMA